jgi:hypothetical protein
VIAAREARSAAEAEAARLLSTELARVQSEAAERLAAQLARSKTEAAETLEIETARARAETTQTMAAEMARERAEAAQAAAAEMDRIRNEAAQTAAAELARVQAEAAQALAAELDRARAESATAAAADLAKTQQEAARALEAEVMHARVEERQAVLAGLDRLLEAMRRLDSAQTLSEVLNVLAGSVADEAARVAMFVARSGRVQGWRFAGFGPEMPEARSVDLAAPETGIIGQAIQTGETAYLPPRPGDPAPAGPHFSQLPEGRVALAVPVRLSGRTVAVVYADDMADEARPVPAAWPEAIEILVRHAGRCLEALTALKTSLTGAYRAAAARPASAPARLQGTTPVAWSSGVRPPNPTPPPEHELEPRGTPLVSRFRIALVADAPRSHPRVRALALKGRCVSPWAIGPPPSRSS